MSSLWSPNTPKRLWLWGALCLLVAIAVSRGPVKYDQLLYEQDALMAQAIESEALFHEALPKARARLALETCALCRQNVRFFQQQRGSVHIWGRLLSSRYRPWTTSLDITAATVLLGIADDPSSILHEAIHAAIREHQHQFPRAANEGLAVWGANQLERRIYRKFSYHLWVQPDKLGVVADLDSVQKLDARYYFEAGMRVQWLEEQAGISGVHRWVEALIDGVPMEDAMSALVDQPWEAIRRATMLAAQKRIDEAREHSRVDELVAIREAHQIKNLGYTRNFAPIAPSSVSALDRFAAQTPAPLLASTAELEAQVISCHIEPPEACAQRTAALLARRHDVIPFQYFRAQIAALHGLNRAGRHDEVYAHGDLLLRGIKDTMGSSQEMLLLEELFTAAAKRSPGDASRVARQWVALSDANLKLRPWQLASRLALLSVVGRHSAEGRRLRTELGAYAEADWAHPQVLEVERRSWARLSGQP